MATITSKLHRRQRNYLFFFGLLYLVFGVVERYVDSESGSLNMWYIFMGVLMLSVLGYQIYNKRLFSVIKWDSQKLTLKAPEQKAILFKRNAIKSIKLTDQSLIINAGLGTGEMLDLHYFKEADIELFSREFVDRISSQLQAA